MVSGTDSSNDSWIRYCFKYVADLKTQEPQNQSECTLHSYSQMNNHSKIKRRTTVNETIK